MKCPDCAVEVKYEWPKDPEKRAAMQLVYEGVLCNQCAGNSYMGSLLQATAGGNPRFKVVNFRQRKNINLEELEAL
jgi:hypothetical protein